MHTANNHQELDGIDEASEYSSFNKNKISCKKNVQIFGRLENKFYLCTRKKEKSSPEPKDYIAEWSSW